MKQLLDNIMTKPLFINISQCRPIKPNMLFLGAFFLILHLVNTPMASAEEESNITSEAGCLEDYQLSCDQVFNWRKYALEKCGNDDRCNDEDYLDRKYRPRTLEEIQKIATRAGTRKNQREKDIRDFFRRKYTSYCSDQAQLSCRSSNSRACTRQFINACSDSRSLEDLLNRYSSALSPLEKQQIIAQADELDGVNFDDYQRLLSRVLELLIQQSITGGI